MHKAKTDQEACDILDNLVIASPCSIPWESMSGDNRKRLCGGCPRHVHNISDMTRKEAQTFLLENGTHPCMIFYRRFDGTIMTDDCPVGLRKIRNAARFVYRVAASFVVLLLSAPGVIAQQLQTDQSARAKELNAQKKPVDLKSLFNNIGKDSTVRQFRDNPAGGAMAMPPAGLPVLQAPGKTVALPNTTTSSTTTPVKEECNTPPLVIRQHANLDTAAHGFFLKGQEAAKSGKKQLAEFFYEKAIDAFDNQKAGDPVFRQELVRALNSVK